jgi:two-component system, NarL family, response regulator NreC
MAKIRVLLTDDHTLFRQGVRTLIAAEPDMEIAGEASNASDAVNASREAAPDVVLMDIGMAGMSSFEAARQIRKERPETRVLFLSMYDDEDYLAECVEIGANGYVLKDSPADQLITAIREANRGGSYLSPRLLTKLVDGFRSGHGAAMQPRFGTLTKRERERRSLPNLNSASRRWKRTSST